MAASERLDEISDILECAVCHRTVYNPKTLTCNHSYCKRCLDKLLQFCTDGTAVIKCPKACMETTNISNNHTTNDLGVDYMLKHIVDVMIIKEKPNEVDKQKLKCDSGIDCVNDVTAYCIICDSFLCQPCIDKHNECQQIYPFVPVSFDVNEQQLKVVCKKHATDATYICCNNEFICLYCVQRNHKGHLYDTMDNEAVKLRGILSKVIEQRATFAQNLSNISTAKYSLDKLLKMRKIRCICDYVDYLSKEEKRIKEELDLVAINHNEEFYNADPTEYYKQCLSKEGIEIVLQKGPIMNTVNEFIGKKKGTKKVTFSLSDHTFNDVHPLGALNVVSRERVPIDKAKKTFKSKLTKDGVEDESIKLLQNIQDLCQEVSGYKFRKCNLTSSHKRKAQDNEVETHGAYDHCNA